jgi:hypothetical protein
VEESQDGTPSLGKAMVRMTVVNVYHLLCPRLRTITTILRNLPWSMQADDTLTPSGGRNDGLTAGGWVANTFSMFTFSAFGTNYHYLKQSAD